MKKSIWFVVYQVVQALVSLGLGVYLGRWGLNLLEYGLFQKYNLLSNWLVANTAFFGTGLFYFIGKSVSEKERIIDRLYTVLLTFVVLIVIAIIAFKEQISWMINYELLSDNYLLICAGLMLRIIASFYSFVAIAIDRLKVLITGQVMHLLCLCTLIYVSVDLDASTVITYLVVSELVRNIFLHFYFKPALILPNKRFPLLSKNELSYLSVVCLSGLVMSLNSFTDKIFVSRILTTQDFAIYTTGAMMLPFIGVVLSSLFTTRQIELVELFNSEKIDEFYRLMRNLTASASSLIIPLLLFVVVFGQQLFLIVFGTEFQQSGTVFRVYSMAFFLLILPVNMVMNIVGFHKHVIYSTLVSVGVNILLCSLLVRLLGVFGIASAVVLSTYIGYLYPYLVLKKKVGLSLIQCIDWTVFFRVFSISLLMLLMSFLFGDMAIVIAMIGVSILVLNNFGKGLLSL